MRTSVTVHPTIRMQLTFSKVLPLPRASYTLGNVLVTPGITTKNIARRFACTELQSYPNMLEESMTIKPSNTYPPGLPVPRTNR